MTNKNVYTFYAFRLRKYSNNPLFTGYARRNFSFIFFLKKEWVFFLCRGIHHKGHRFSIVKSYVRYLPMRQKKSLPALGCREGFLFYCYPLGISSLEELAAVLQVLEPEPEPEVQDLQFRCPELDLASPRL